jgi:hypothetical protein
MRADLDFFDAKNPSPTKIEWKKMIFPNEWKKRNNEWKKWGPFKIYNFFSSKSQF